MLTIIYDLLTLFIAYFCMQFITEYVFLEPKLKYQKWYSIGAFVLMYLGYFTLGSQAGTVLLCISIGLSISLARKRNKISGFFMFIPILGMCDGMIVPILNIAQLMFLLNKKEKAIFAVVLYTILILLVVLLWNKGEDWRKNFEKEKEYRQLTDWERKLLYIIGILLCFSSVQLESNTQITNLDSVMVFFIGTNSMIAFVFTITVIVMIMQGNKKAYYHKKVSKLQYNIIITMADIIESRDENTGDHIKRTAKYVELIANKLKEKNQYTDILTEKYIADMIIAAPLHDIGKIHVSDLILNKPGRLTEEEFEIMKSHTTAGSKMLMQAEENLGGSSYLKIAMQMAEYHHEWWNGKGYPNGISGEEIPLCARIMAVADVFDALISKRCYKDAMPLEKAYRIIKEESGTHFDPEIVAAFLECEEQKNMIKKRGV